MIPVPRCTASLAGWFIKSYCRAKGKEHGLDPVRFMALQTIHTFVREEDLARSREVLGFDTGGIMEALEDTVRACLTR